MTISGRDSSVKAMGFTQRTRGFESHSLSPVPVIAIYCVGREGRMLPNQFTRTSESSHFTHRYVRAGEMNDSVREIKQRRIEPKYCAIFTNNALYVY